LAEFIKKYKGTKIVSSFHENLYDAAIYDAIQQNIINGYTHETFINNLSDYFRTAIIGSWTVEVESLALVLHFIYTTQLPVGRMTNLWFLVLMVKHPIARRFMTLNHIPGYEYDQVLFRYDEEKLTKIYCTGVGQQHQICHFQEMISCITQQRRIMAKKQMIQVKTLRQICKDNLQTLDLDLAEYSIILLPLDIQFYQKQKGDVFIFPHHTLSEVLYEPKSKQVTILVVGNQSPDLEPFEAIIITNGKKMMLCDNIKKKNQFIKKFVIKSNYGFIGWISNIFPAKFLGYPKHINSENVKVSQLKNIINDIELPVELMGYTLVMEDIVIQILRTIYARCCNEWLFI
jgi:hypothetical protein